MAKLNFQHHYSSLQSHDPLEIILIYANYADLQETFPIISNVECCLIYLKYKSCNMTTMTTVTFDQFNASLLR